MHSRPYRETSLLLDIFSLEWGKISAVAKGVRGSKNERKSLLQPFQLLWLNVSGKHELKNLLQVEAQSAALSLQGNNLFSAMYLNELLNRLLAKEMPHPELFEQYQASLGLLADNPLPDTALRQFELSLLADLGYGIDLSQDAESGQSVESQGFYRFVSELGLQRMADKINHPNCFYGEHLLQIAAFDWTPQSLGAAKILNRLALAPLLGDKPLKSRELFRQNWPAKTP